MVGTRSSAGQLRLLAIMPIERQGDWLRACFLCGGGRDLQVLQVATTHDAAAALRQQSFDLLVLWHEGLGQGVIDGWHQLAQLGGDAGFVALGMHVCEGWQEPLFAAGALACLDMDQTDPVTLVHTLRTSAELERLRRESQVWEMDRARLREREARDIDRVLAGQRSLLERLDQFGGAPSGLSEDDAAAVTLSAVSSGAPSPSAAPITAHSLPTADLLAAELGAFYLQSLQSFIFDETQSSAEAIAELSERFIEQAATSSTIMRVHLSAVTQITSRGGTGSMRHCLAGADRFLMELLMRLVDRHTIDRHTIDPAAAAQGPHDRSQADRPGGQRHAASDAQGRKGRLHTASSPLAAA